ncbi:uncharacterized protein LOC116132760 [Pistacia vera]|uniref:uncharacterized protein LOC116132760 n=1 Tax=Pistacia vera TaxID=55513 RepID=UPI001262FD0A|nr:uncharacterized protein LOC116132760 [Pistacia vera]
MKNDRRDNESGGHDNFELAPNSSEVCTDRHNEENGSRGECESEQKAPSNHAIVPYPHRLKNQKLDKQFDYVSKWVEAAALPTNDARVVMKFVKKNIFSGFGTPKAIISDSDSYFCNRQFATLLSKYGVTHRIATPCHPQTSGQDRELKWIL